jgi:hypothetical protein
LEHAAPPACDEGARSKTKRRPHLKADSASTGTGCCWHSCATSDAASSSSTCRKSYLRAQQADAHATQCSVDERGSAQGPAQAHCA